MPPLEPEGREGRPCLKDSPPGKYGLLTGSRREVNIQPLQAFLLHSGEAWSLPRGRAVIDTMRLPAAGEVREPDQAGERGDSWPRSRSGGVGRGEEERGQLSSQAPHSYFSLIPNPTVACGGDGLGCRASRFLRG